MRLLDRLRGRPTIGSFAAALIATLREAGFTDELRFDSGAGTIVRSRDGEPVGLINLANMFRTYREAPRKDRPEHLRRFGRVAMTTSREAPSEYELARPDLWPRLWTASSNEFQRLRCLAGGPGDKEPQVVSQPVGRHLMACLAYDWPESVQSTSPDWLERWGVTPNQALEIAISNLEEPAEGYAAFGTNLYSFVAGDSYDATRILLTGLIGRMKVLGRYVAMAPNRDTLLITGTEDDEGMGMMAGLAEKALGEAYPLAGMPLVLGDGQWVDWMPPAGHPLHRRFR